MSNLSPEQIKKRRQKLQENALKSVMARGQFNFRLDGKDIRRLYSLAGERKTPVSSMVREWVLERLATEETSTCAAPLWAKNLESRLSSIETYLRTLANQESTTDSNSALEVESGTKKQTQTGKNKTLYRTGKLETATKKVSDIVSKKYNSKSKKNARPV